MVKQEQLDFLADNPFYTKRFAFFIGRRCRASSIQDVARETRLNWKTGKALEMQYMREQLWRAGTLGPRVIGLDEVDPKRPHTCVEAESVHRLCAPYEGARRTFIYV